jgi:hypothetical protein
MDLLYIFQENMGLKDVNLSHNEFSDNAAIVLGEALGKLTFIIQIPAGPWEENLPDLQNDYNSVVLNINIMLFPYLNCDKIYAYLICLMDGGNFVLQYKVHVSLKKQL